MKFFEQKWKKSIFKSMGCHHVPLGHESFHLEFSFISMFFLIDFLKSLGLLAFFGKNGAPKKSIDQIKLN